MSKGYAHSASVLHEEHRVRGIIPQRQREENQQHGRLRSHRGHQRHIWQQDSSKRKARSAVPEVRQELNQ